MSKVFTTEPGIITDSYEGIKITIYQSEVRPEFYYLNVSGLGLEDSELKFDSIQSALKRGKELIDEYLTPYEDEYANQDEDEF
jgi:hypothetical protein